MMVSNLISIGLLVFLVSQYPSGPPPPFLGWGGGGGGFKRGSLVMDWTGGGRRGGGRGASGHASRAKEEDGTEDLQAPGKDQEAAGHCPVSHLSPCLLSASPNTHNHKP